MIYTLGYGRTTRKRFETRMKALHEKVPDLLVIDIRKRGSQSRNGRWCWHPRTVGDLRRTEPTIQDVIELSIGIDYISYEELWNEHGNTQIGLEDYREMLAHKRSMQDAFVELSDMVADVFPICLLCSEEKPFKPNGQPNCHRVILAEVIAKRIGIEVVHVGDNRKPSFFAGWEKVIKNIEL